MQHIHNDGGRKAAGYKGKAGDCVTRAIAIATQQPYEQVRQGLMAQTRHWIDTSRSRAAKRQAQDGATVSKGVFREVYDAYLKSLGWVWVATMRVGSGCQVHLRASELPAGRIICRLSKHICAVVDHVVHDTYDPSRAGTRCVYGYWHKPA
jgi:hypothetical protein